MLKHRYIYVPHGQAKDSEVMDAALSAEAQAALEGIVDQGYKGWTDDISARTVHRYLRYLEAAGAYDPAMVLAYARQTKWERAIQRLEKMCGWHVEPEAIR